MNNSTRRVIPYPQADRSDPPDTPLHFKNLVDFLDLDVIYTQGTDAARIAAAHQTSGGKIWWSTDTLQYWYDDGTTWRLIGASISRGTLASRPAAAAGNANAIYVATDTNGGTPYYSDASVWTQMGGSVAIPPVGIDIKAGNYTLVATDRFRIMRMDGGGTLTIPDDTTLFSVGESVDIIQWGASQVTIAGAGGVTVNGFPGLKSLARYTEISVIKMASNTWLAVGGLTT